MQRSDLLVLVKELRKLCSIFGRTFDESLGMSYAETLESVPIDLIVANARAAALGDRFPLPKDLMASADAESPEVAATRAWEITRPHFARHTEPDDPIAREVVRLLGGSAYNGGKDSDEIGTWVRKEFLRLYVERMKDGKRQEFVGGMLDAASPRGVESGEPTKLEANDFRAVLSEKQPDNTTAPIDGATPTNAKYFAPGHQVRDRGVVVATIGEFGGYASKFGDIVVIVDFTDATHTAVREIHRVQKSAGGSAG